MNRLPRIAPWVLFTLAAALCVAVCRQRLIPTIPIVSAAVAAVQDPTPPDQGQDPAAANLAPSGPSYTTQAPPPPGQSAVPGQPPDDSTYAEQPTETATQAPPPLPDYDQPPPPADGYIWTPGYWAGGLPATIGCPARGLSRPIWVRSGRPGIGDSTAAAIPSIPATGACISDSMAVSTTGLATWASVTRAAIGIPDTSSTTAPTTTWTHESYTTCTAITQAIGLEASLAPASMADRAVFRFGRGRLKRQHTVNQLLRA